MGALSKETTREEPAMTDLLPYGASRPTVKRSESRRASRALGSLHAGTRMETARIEAAAEIQAVRADAVTYVGKRAMQDLTMLTQLEQQLAGLVPLAASRLQAIGDMTALAVTEIVSDTARRIR